MIINTLLTIVITITISVIPVDILAEWSIGIYEGASPVLLEPKVGVVNPVLTAEDVTDVSAEFVADPFIIRENDLWYMFFEVLDATDGLGKIAYATSVDGIEWTYQNIILSRDYHMSYPYVFKWNDDYYLIPETYQIGSINLFKATNFPNDWVLNNRLISGRPYKDSSIIYYENMWWLFSTGASAEGNLYLFYSDILTGLWAEHPLSPIITNDLDMGRSGGRIVIHNNLPIRYSQDTYPTYGNKVNAFEIVDISTTTYQEVPVDENPIVMSSGYGWTENGMHHVDPYLKEDGLWIAAVDGTGDPDGPAGVPRENWELLYVDSEEISAINGLAINALDGDYTTIWHTEFSNDPDPTHPHEIQIDLDGSFQIEGFSYLPRQDGEIDGGVMDYEFFVSQDGIWWEAPVVTGVFDSSSDRKFVIFDPAIGSFMKFKALSEINDNQWTSVAEIALLGFPAATTNLAPNGIILQPEQDVTIRIGEELEFTGTGEDSDENYPLSYHWHFGEGSGIPDSYVQDPGFIQFTKKGTYDVSLTVTDALGLIDPSPDVLTVNVGMGKGHGKYLLH